MFKETLPSRGRAETPELERQERLERGHRVAVLCLQLEKYLIDEQQPTWEGFLTTNPEITIASPERQAAMQKLIETTNQYNTGLGEMKKLLEMDQKSPEEVATFIFKTKVGYPPLGRVSLETQGGYVIFYCEKMGDYKAFGKLNRESGGTMHRAIDLDVSFQVPSEFFPGETSTVSYSPPTLLIQGLKSEYYTGQTIIHERQHFIYDVLFREDILSRDESSRKEVARDRLKDEMMAFFRDGARGSSALDNPQLYGWIFETLGKKYEEIVQQFAQAVDQTPTPIKRKARGLIAYQLMLAPVESYPRLYKKIVDFYVQRPELIEKVEVSPEEMYSPSIPLKIDELPPDLDIPQPPPLPLIK